jgi:hypothetical protein
LKGTGGGLELDQCAMSNSVILVKV